MHREVSIQALFLPSYNLRTCGGFNNLADHVRNECRLIDVNVVGC